MILIIFWASSSVTSDLVILDLAADSPSHKYTEEIRHAAERAAALTRQLLVFCRKQAVQTVVLDLNEVLKELGKMLHRLIDENVELTVVPGKTNRTSQS
ncbi:MAG: hypothetical protein WDM76_15065 [Limisphaerales bacterium]